MLQPGKFMGCTYGKSAVKDVFVEKTGVRWAPGVAGKFVGSYRAGLPGMTRDELTKIISCGTIQA